MASRWVSAALAVALLSLFLFPNYSAAKDVIVPESAEKTDEAAADVVLRLPSERSIPSQETPVAEDASRDLPEVKADHQDAADQIPQQDQSTTLERSDLAAFLPNPETSLIPVRSRFHRVHLNGPLQLGDREGGMRSFWYLRPRRHSRLFHKLFLDGREGGPMEVRFRMPQIQFPMEIPQVQVEGGQQQPARVLTFRIRRLGPHHHHGMMMHNCAWRKRMEAAAAALASAEQQQQQVGEQRQQEDGFTGLMKRFTVFLNPQQQN